MFRRQFLLFVLLTALLFVAPSAPAQVQTGTPQFGSFSGGPEIINNANLNVHWTIPIRHKPGRGTNFDYDLTYDSSVWMPVTANGTTTWQPVSATTIPGWTGLIPAGNAYITYSVAYSQGNCWNNGPVTYQQWNYSNFVYYDSTGSTTAPAPTATALAALIFRVRAVPAPRPDPPPRHRGPEPLAMAAPCTSLRPADQ